jgi:hypothetical protein
VFLHYPLWDAFNGNAFALSSEKYRYSKVPPDGEPVF